jgi:hypothetical protein
MDEIDALGRQMLLERPRLSRGRLSVFRESTSSDEWFPRLGVTLKRAGTDQILWQWASHAEVVEDEPPPYGDELMLEKYFELDLPLRSPRGLECVFLLGPGASNRGSVKSFSAALYLYPKSLDERGIQVGVIDFPDGLTNASVPSFFRVNFPW